MTYYGPKEIAASFRTVRNNTLKIAEEIPEEQYGFSAAPGTRTIAQTLIHISNLHKFQLALHGPRLTTLAGFDFMALMGPLMAEEQKTHTKAEILAKLRQGAEEFTNLVEGMTEAALSESLAMPPGGSPPSRTRFDMIISVKEHEMHHRAQLMVCQRMLGLTPHLTREAQARMAAMQAAQAKS